MTIPSLAKIDWNLATLQFIPDVVCATDTHGYIMVANAAMASSFRFASTDELIGKTAFDVLPVEAAQELSEADARVIRSGKPEFDVEQQIIYADGRTQWIQSSRAPLFDSYSNVTGVVTVSRDVSARKESERLMLAQTNLLDMVAQSLPIGEILAKIVTVIEEHLPGMTGSIRISSTDSLLFQESVAPNLSTRYPTFFEQDDAGHKSETALSATSRTEPMIVPDLLDSSFWSADRDAAARAGIRSFWSSPIFSYETKILGVFNLYSSKVAAPTDVQMDLVAMACHMVSAAIERKETEERTKFLASHDVLTGLSNRLMFEERLSSAIEIAREQRSYLVLAFFDLDNFKLINDSFGHGAGDELLKIVAERAKQGIRQNDLVARLGGDEFVMFMTATQKSDALEARLSEVRRSISAPVSLSGRTLQVTCSMGIACFPDHAQTSGDLLAHADAAMYRAKKFGRDNLQIFSADMADLAEERLIMNVELRKAITECEFILHYQPQVNAKTGRIFGAEALVRWNHPTRGLIPPGDFIKTAEDTGLIVPLGDWILHEACRQNKLWQDAGYTPIVVSVNVSARQFREPDWVKRVGAALEQSGLDPRYIELELTESLIIQDMAVASGKMRELEALGVQFAIDDFGTGYSSLSVLKGLPVQCLKIDRSFVQEIPDNESDKAITAAIIVMAHALKLRTIAEGVETAAQLQFLREHNCDEMQGFYYSKPLEADKFESLFLSHGWTPVDFQRFDRDESLGLCLSSS